MDKNYEKTEIPKMLKCGCYSDIRLLKLPRILIGRKKVKDVLKKEK